MYLVEVIPPFAEPEKPLPAGNPDLVVTDAANPGIAQRRSFIWQQDPFRPAHHAKAPGINLSDKERGPMPENMVISRSPASIDQKEPFSNPRPVLLRVVTAQGFPVLKGPLPDLLENQSIPAARHIATVIRPQGEIEPLSVLDE
jgi:hypothetical protein